MHARQLSATTLAELVLPRCTTLKSEEEAENERATEKEISLLTVSPSGLTVMGVNTTCGGGKRIADDDQLTYVIRGIHESLSHRVAASSDGDALRLVKTTHPYRSIGWIRSRDNVTDDR